MAVLRARYHSRHKPEENHLDASELVVYILPDSTRSSAGSERCPPKAEVTGSNPVGCAILFNQIIYLRA
jgi:hypothetical protein